MKLQTYGSNQTIVTLTNGTEIFFSYTTPVAAFVPGKGYLRTATSYSRTTARHITQWLHGAAATSVEQTIIDALAS